ncbi:MAG TPA: ABC transporter substrate-binding protein [Tepidisphaeraceae bacterium]|jgi:multiple sugar transport system substrate-binding protein
MRRIVLLVICGLLLTTACDRSGDGLVGKTTIRFWNGFTGPDGRTMLQIVKRFNDANPDLNVIMQRMEWGTYYNKLFVAGLSGRAPEVFVSHSYALRRFMGAGFVRPVDDLIGVGEGKLDPADFDANVLANLETGGQHWGIPLDVHPLGMFYNKTMFKLAGIVDEKGEARPPRNREEFMEACRKLTDRKRSQWGFVFTWQRTNCFSVVRQFGGRLADPLSGEPTMALRANVEALDWCATLVREKLVPAPQDFNAWIGFRQGKVGMAFEGIYMMPDLVKQEELDWGAAPMPVLGKEPAAWGETHSMVLRKDLEGKKLDGAKRLIRYLSDHSLEWAAAGQVPVRKSLRESDVFKKMYAQSQFAKEIPYISYLPASTYVFEFLTEWDLAVELVLRGTLTAEDALRQAQEKMVRIAGRAGGGA